MRPFTDSDLVGIHRALKKGKEIQLMREDNGAIVTLETKEMDKNSADLWGDYMVIKVSYQKGVLYWHQYYSSVDQIKQYYWSKT